MLIETESQTRSEAVARPRTGLAAATWERVALALVLLLAAVLDFWQLNLVGYGNTYYAAAVKSMLQNWHAFFFNSFDSFGFVTIDKPPLGFWIQAASAKLFGFNGLSLMLPQALAGVLSVAVLYYLVRRVFGVMAGLLAALALAVMPVSVAASRDNIIDGLLVLTVLLAAWAVTRAVETGRLRWLLLCAVLVGLGFNIKMLEAYLVVPAFGLLYLLAAPVRWWARLGHLAVATVVLLAISLSWVTAVDLTPASARPYVGSSGTNSELNLALGYNGLNRLTGNVFGRGRRAVTGDRVPRASGGSGSGSTASRATLGGFTRGETGNPGPLRLFNAALGSQVSWLLPLALVGLVVAGLQTRRRFPLDRRGQAVVLWGSWLLTQAIFFSVAGFFHTYYMVMFAPSIAALAGIGLVALWQDYRRAGWRGWLLPLVLVGTAAIQAYLLSPYADWSRWLTPLVVACCAIAAALLALARLGARFSRPVLRGALVAGMLALLVAPTAWAADTALNTRGGGIPTAGPPPQNGGGGILCIASVTGCVRIPPQNGGNRSPGAARAQTGRRGFGGFGGRDDTGASTQLVQYLEAHRGHTRYLVATLNAMSAAPIILATGQPVMALGGFSGADRIVTPGDLAGLVSDGTVRFFLLSSFSPRSLNLDALPPQMRALIEERGDAPRGGGGFGGFGGGQNGDLVQWVSQNCAVVPSALWQPGATQSPNATGSPSTGGRGSGTGGFGFFGRGGGGEQLYDCASRPGGHASSSTTSSALSAPSTRSTPPQGRLGQGGAAPSQSRPALSGQLVSTTDGTITVQSFQGAQSLPTTPSTRYYLATPASSSALAVGQHVAVAPAFGAASGSTAASVTIAPRVDLYVSVRRLGTLGGGGFGGSGGLGGLGNSGPSSGGSRGFGGGRRALAGTITALTGQRLTLRATDGTTHTIGLTASTTVYHVVAAMPAQFQAGSFVTVSAATVTGRRVAADVVGTTTAGTMVSVVPSAGATSGPTS